MRHNFQTGRETDCKGRQIGERIKSSWHRKKDCKKVCGQLFKALVAGIWLRTVHKYMFLFPLKKLRLRLQWCVTGCTPSREFHWSHVRCAGCLQDVPRGQTHGLYSESHQADLCPARYSWRDCWRLSKHGRRWEKVQNRLDSAAGFSDRPHRPGNRAGSHLKKGGLVRFPHFLSDSSGKQPLSWLFVL